MTEFLVLEGNPKRKRRKHHAKKIKTTSRRKIKKNPARKIKIKNITQKIKGFTMKRKKHSRRRFHRNPPLMSKLGNIGATFKPALIGAAGIAVNKFLSGQVAKVAKIDAKNKTIVELLIALFGLPMLGKLLKQPMLAQAGQVAAAVAIFEFVKPQLPAAIQVQLSGYSFPTELTPAALPEAAPFGDDTIDPGMSYVPEMMF